MRVNLEIPQGKRTKLYRFFEILPGLISYGAIILLFVLSWVDPVLGAIYLFIIISSTLVKAISVAYRTIQGYEVIKRAEKVNWRKRMEDLENPREAYERVHDDMTAYNEGIEILEPSIEAVKNSTFPKDRIVFALAYEERGGEAIEKTAELLSKKYRGVFKDFLLVKHPANLPGEVIGKGPNLTYAGYRVAEYFENLHHLNSY